MPTTSTSAGNAGALGGMARCRAAAAPPQAGRALAQSGIGAAGWFQRNRETLRYALPAYRRRSWSSCWSTGLVFGNTHGVSAIAIRCSVLSCFLAILALGQGTVILTGGLDLSVPWTIGLCGILLAGFTGGQNDACVGGAARSRAWRRRSASSNGLGVVVLGLSPIVMTLATNGILQGAALVYSNGTPAGFASPAVRWLMTGRLFGMTPVVWVLAVFVLARPASRTDRVRPAHLRRRQQAARRRALGRRRRARRCRRLRRSRASAPPSSASCSPASPGRRALAWATTTFCPRSRSWWSAAR